MHFENSLNASVPFVLSDSRPKSKSVEVFDLTPLVIVLQRYRKVDISKKWCSYWLELAARPYYPSPVH